MLKNSHVVGPESIEPLSNRFIVGLAALAAVIYFFSNPKPQSYYDYTFRVAGNLLHSAIGFPDKPPSWLNEFVPFEGSWYSVFPLGAVVSMIPVAILKAVGFITEMPGAVIGAMLAGLVSFLLLKIASKYEISQARQILLPTAIVLGTFVWTNLTFAGAWQLALGFAMFGELGAIYFTIYDRRPLLAGIFFAIAFGNRTENLLTAPVFMFLLMRDDAHLGDVEAQRKKGKREKNNNKSKNLEVQSNGFVSSLRHRVSAVQTRQIAAFCSVPFVLGISTLIYNYVRFHSFTDFGYARIPGVLQEPWYDHGIFSTTYIPRQAWEMLGKLWEWKPKFPYFFPDGFSNSILLSSPFLLFIFRLNPRDKALKFASWAAIIILTFLLWIHGNSGGWQFGYRYAMILLPWVYVILLETAPKRITPTEWAVYGFSFIANAYATWIFHWTEYLKQ